MGIVIDMATRKRIDPPTLDYSMRADHDAEREIDAAIAEAFAATEPPEPPKPVRPTEERTYLSCAETAKLIRVALKKAFPGVKFSVRSDTYAGGASIRVGCPEGVDPKAVDKVAGRYAGGGFDGMIDMKYHDNHWLMPDGSVVLAYSPGTEGSRGSVPAASNPKPHPDAKLVSFGADFVFVHKADGALAGRG